jgi:MscS family membrane protein
MNTFRQAMAKDYPFTVPRLALKCLDLSEAPTLVRETGGAQRAIKLYEILTTADYDQAIPTSPEGDLYVVYRQPSGDRIALARGHDGHWRFDAETVIAAERMNQVLIKKGSIEKLLAPHFAKKVLGLYLYQWSLLILPLILFYFLGRIMLGVARILVRRRFPYLDEWAPPGILRAFPWFLASLAFTGATPMHDLPLQYLVVFTALAKLFTACTGVWLSFGIIDVIEAYIPRFGVYKKARLHNAVLPMTARTLKVMVACIGLLFLAQNLDINVWSLFAGFSVIGAMIALAGQDFIKNLFGSVTVVLDQPFDIGDWVVIDDVEGTVEEVGFRSTRVRTFYNSLITFPNSILLTAKVDNYGAREFRRYKQNIQIAHHTPQPLIEAFCEAIRELVRRHPYTRKDYYHVVLNDVTPDGLQILLYIFWKTPDWDTELRERHRLLSDILLVASRLGVELTPTMTRVQLSNWTPTEPSDQSYDKKSYDQATEEGCRLAKDVVTAVLAEGEARPAPVVILSEPRVLDSAESTTA